MGAIDPWGMASFDPSGLIGMIYIGSTRHRCILNILLSGTRQFGVYAQGLKRLGL